MKTFRRALAVVFVLLALVFALRIVHNARAHDAKAHGRVGADIAIVVICGGAAVGLFTADRRNVVREARGPDIKS
jgi:hypothetical protein